MVLLLACCGLFARTLAATFTFTSPSFRRKPESSLNAQCEAL